MYSTNTSLYQDLKEELLKAHLTIENHENMQNEMIRRERQMRKENEVIHIVGVIMLLQCSLCITVTHLFLRTFLDLPHEMFLL